MLVVVSYKPVSYKKDVYDMKILYGIGYLCFAFIGSAAAYDKHKVFERSRTLFSPKTKLSSQFLRSKVSANLVRQRIYGRDKSILQPREYCTSQTFNAGDHNALCFQSAKERELCNTKT